MFDEELYQVEMARLLTQAAEALRRRDPSAVVYTISIWTDPNAAVSAVSFDTADNSAMKVGKAEAWASQHHARHLAAGDHARAQLFAPRPTARNGNPADFAFRNVAEVEHHSFERGWETATGGACWDVLEPALLKVRDRALAVYAALQLHGDAQLGVNSRRDWFDRVVGLGSLAS
jgi:hypothetical protein